MNQIKSSNPKPLNKRTFRILLGFVALSFILNSIPFLSALLSPLNQFETIIHELGHAFACLSTGGNVSGLTIVSDGMGHGGLTFCHGGNPFIYGQTGYLGEALFGCSLILLARFPSISRSLLFTLGIGIGASSLYFMPGTIFVEGQWQQGLGSLLWGLAMACGFVYAGKKLNDSSAYLLLLFIASQAALNSISGMWLLLIQSFGFYSGVWSDATNMQQLTGVPAFFWGIFWSALSLGAFSSALFLTYKMDNHRKS